ncbi:MAG: response regulator [Elusimicrobia bacterium]|jgi:PleD family two-component response regulator|nr:response regulator [Elusimicrobiota bacterium]
MTEAPARILVVEDEPTTSKILGLLLTKEGYAVSFAGDGKTALVLALAERPDLILLDVLLPELSGFEVCQRLRQDPSTCLIPIMLLTALSEIKDKVTGFKLGADEYVTKPFDVLELLARVGRVLRRSREGLAANPLTGLPGGVAVEEEIRRRVVAKAPFSVARVAVSGLGEFNMAYGYERGDHVIRLVGMILKSAVLELADRNDIAAHFGTADFGFVSTPARAEVVAARVLENAEVLLMMQYDEPDRVRGRFERGSGPLMNLKAGIVDVFPGGPTHSASIQDVVRAALREAKQFVGPHLIRRSVGGEQG